MLSDFTYNAYVGFWINWSKGPIMGSTLTLSSQNGSIFLAFLVIFVQYAGSQSWNIVKYLIHRHRVRRRISVPETGPEFPPPPVRHKRESGDYYQEQIILRNESSDASAVCQFLSLAYRWRRRIPHMFFRFPFLCILIITTLHAAGWIAAGLFVSKVVDTGNQEVLIKGVNCGYPNLTFDTGQKSEMLTANNKVLSDMNAAWSYARACYGDASAAPLYCMMPNRQLYGTYRANATCPFPGLCVYSDHDALSLDSGTINSNRDLGINAQTSDQINYHRVTTCAPLNTTGFKNVSNATEESYFPVGHIIESFNFGYNPYFSDGNATFQYDRHANTSFPGYQIYTIQGSYSNHSGYWAPVTQLNRSDADVTLIFLSAATMFYGSPVDDPIFAAHNTYYTENNETYYTADDNVTVIGCADQHEFCLTQQLSQGNLSCTGLRSEATVIEQLTAFYFDSEMTTAQLDTANHILFSLGFATISSAIQSRLSSSLNASNGAMGNVQTSALPVDQWQTEVDTWLATVYAYLQYTITQYASGQNNYNASRIIQPQTAYEWTMCNQQIIKSPAGYQSFSFLGIALIIVLGTIIMIIGWAPGRIGAAFWPRKRHRDDRQLGQYCRKAWNLDNKFHLLRMALESESSTSWESTSDKQIPLSVKGGKSEKGIQYFKIDAPG